MRLLENACKSNLMLKIKKIKLTLMKYACILSHFFLLLKGKLNMFLIFDHYVSSWNN